MQSSARRAAAALAALLMGAGLALATPATAADDTTAPTLAGPVTFTPAAVDITDHDATTTVRIPIADAGSGVASVELELSGPGVPAATVDLQQTSGTAASGVWTGTQSFSPRFDTAGTWTVAALTATDRAGNSAQLDAGGAKVTVTRTSDTAAPVLLGVTAVTTAVDTTAGPAAATVRVRATDDLSGVVAGTVRFTSPDGDIAEGRLTGAPVEGTATNGSWDVPVVFDARSTPGMWQLAGVEIGDGQNNVAAYDSSAPQLDPLRIAVSTTDDGTAPVLTSLKVGPAKRSTAYGTSGWVYAQVGYTDDVSGVDSVTVTLKRPSGVPDDNDPQPVVVADADIRTGTTRAGTVTVPIYVDGFTPGSWKVAAVDVVDVAGNVTALTGTTSGSGGALVAAAGFDVSTTAADTLAPTVGGYAFSPATVDTRGGSADGTVLVTATDPDTVPAGIVSGSVGLRSPSGNQTAVAAFTGDDLAAGDPAAGTFRARFSLPADAEDGAWTATSVTVVDGAGRRSTVSGGATTLTVLGTGSDPATVPAAPTITRATVSGTAATVGWTVPDNGGAALTGYRVSATSEGLAPRSITAPGTATTVSVPNLNRGRSWTFTVTARNAVGDGPASVPSAPVAVAAGVPDAPRIGTASPAGDGTSAVVAWSAPVDDGGSALTGYRVVALREGVPQPAVELGPDATRTTVTGLDRGRRYTFRVLATNAQGTGPASQPSGSIAVPATLPGTPVVTSTVPVGRTVTVRWSAPDDGGAPITAYRVTGSPAGGCSSVTTSCVVTGLDEGTTYSFTVSATNRVGAGDLSTDSPAVTAQAPRPASLSASAPATIVRGAALTVTGRFLSAGRGVAGTVVRAQYRLAGTATWVTAASARTAADGGVRVVGVRPARTAAVRLVSVSVGDYVPATSAARTVTVSRVVTLRTPARSVARGRTLALTGTASPLHRGTLVLQRWTGRSWQQVSSRRVATSSYRFTVRPKVRGTVRYRVVAAADGWFAAAHSATRSVRVR